MESLYNRNEMLTSGDERLLLKAWIVEKYSLYELKRFYKRVGYNWYHYSYFEEDWLYDDQEDLARLMADHEYFDIGLQLVKLRIQKWKRVKARIKPMIKSGNAYFITLTFNDQSFNCFSDESRRRLVIYCLNKYNDYIANKDYGEENGREHYHAIVRDDLSVLTNNFNWPYGFYNIKQIKPGSEEALSTYILKFTNHSTKETVRGSRPIYKRLCRESR